MTFEEWAGEVTEDFQAAGFTVKEYLGFPLVSKPEGQRESVRLTWAALWHRQRSAASRFFAR